MTSKCETNVFDVIIIGAGISGVAAAHHLQEKCPDQSFAILEAKENFGGTWDTHSYPGVRCDSDMFTFGYKFKPWLGDPVAPGEDILNYIGEVVEADNLEPHIRYQHKVISASWSSQSKAWSLKITTSDDGRAVTFTAKFLFMCQGCYDHEQGYTPKFAGRDEFEGIIVHPQSWPDDLDYANKKVVVIGSGATSASLIPEIAGDCEHLTMLQRSPSYYWAGENRSALAERLRFFDMPEAWVHDSVRKSLWAEQHRIQILAKSQPDMMKKELLAVVKHHIGDHYNIEKHFTPRYNPWEQRLGYLPDGDLFETLKAENVSLVTDHIEGFVPEGIVLKSGATIEADIIITATGLNLSIMGGIEFHVDDERVNFGQTLTWRGIMYEGIPNMASVFGYFRSSWTLRAELISEFVCTLLNHMEAEAAKVCTPVRPQDDMDMNLRPWIDPEDFNPGFMRRKMDLFPKQGDKAPWVFDGIYVHERAIMQTLDLADDNLVFAA